jgi:hypothetical protein
MRYVRRASDQHRRETLKHGTDWAGTPRRIPVVLHSVLDAPRHHRRFHTVSQFYRATLRPHKSVPGPVHNLLCTDVSIDFCASAEYVYQTPRAS